MTTNEQRSENDWILLRCDPTKQVTGFMWAARRAGWDEQEIANFIEEVFHLSADGLRRSGGRNDFRMRASH
jgi:hypothetical protein